MAASVLPRNVLEQAARTLVACKQIDPDLQIGSFSLAAFAEAIGQAQAIQVQIEALRLQLIDLRNRRDEQLAELWEQIKRARALVRGTYGDDSSEYELIGGTRMSERKRRRRKPQGKIEGRSATDGEG